MIDDPFALSETLDTWAAAVHTDHPVIPGMPNLHSHAFQRGFAGLTEFRSVTDGDDPAGGDSFWSWRSLMYRFALRVSPDALEAMGVGVDQVNGAVHGTTGR